MDSDIDDVVALEAEVLDGLDRADDKAPEGTVPLSAARRRRALDDVSRLLAAGGA